MDKREESVCVGLALVTPSGSLGGLVLILSTLSGAGVALPAVAVGLTGWRLPRGTAPCSSPVPV